MLRGVVGQSRILGLIGEGSFRRLPPPRLVLGFSTGEDLPACPLECISTSCGGHLVRIRPLDRCVFFLADSVRHVAGGFVAYDSDWCRVGMIAESLGIDRPREFLRIAFWAPRGFSTL